MLRRPLGEQGVEPETGAFRLVAVGPLDAGSTEAGRQEHDRRRDIVAAMEKALTGTLLSTGCWVINKVSSHKSMNIRMVM